MNRHFLILAVAGQAMPPGKYAVVRDSGSTSLRLRDTISGNGFFVSDVGATFHIPMTRRESELAQATPAETVSVTLAE